MSEKPNKEGLDPFTAQLSEALARQGQKAEPPPEVEPPPQKPPPSAVLESLAPCDLAKYLLGAHYWNAAAKLVTLVYWRKQWWEWDRKCWRVVDDDTLRSRVYKFLNKAQVKLGNIQKTFDPTQPVVSYVIDALKSEVNLSADVEMPSWLGAVPGWRGEVPRAWIRDAEKWTWVHALIPVQNGLLVPWSRRLVEHTPRFFSRNVLGFEYRPGAQAQRFVQFLGELFPDQADAQLGVKELIGIAFTDDLSHQKMWMFVGPKRGGRGTLGRLLRGLIGEENYLGTTFQTMGEPFGMEGWIGKKLVVFPDATLEGVGKREMGRIVERLKLTTGQDSQPINQKNIKHWNGTLNARVVSFSNEPILFRDATDAMPSRVITYQMTQTFFGREDTHLTKKLLAERSGILNLALDALDELAHRGRLIQPESGEELSEILVENSNDLTPFIRECCEVGPKAGEWAQVLFDAYREWGEKKGFSVGGWGVPQFSAKLSAACPIPLKHSRPRGGGINRPVKLLGIGLRNFYTKDVPKLTLVPKEPELPSVAQSAKLDRRF